MVFPEDNLMSRLFTPEIAAYYEKYYEGKGVTFIKGDTVTGELFVVLAVSNTIPVWASGQALRLVQSLNDRVMLLGANF